MSVSRLDGKVHRLLKSEQPQMRNIKDAQVNLTYQRSPANRLALLQKISKKFAWPKFGVIVLNRAKDGTLDIIDGAGRHHIVYTILKQNCEVPCVIVNDLPVEEQAQLFVEINRDQKHPNSGDIFKARVAMKDPVAVKIKAIFDQIGLTIGDHSGPKNIASVQSVERIFHAGDNLPLVLAIKKNEWKDDVVGGGYLEGIDLFLRAVPGCDLPAFRKVLSNNPEGVTGPVMKKRGGGEMPLKRYIGCFAAVYWAEKYNYNRKIHKASADRIRTLADTEIEAKQKAA
jgi:hypothetical protein